jgi:hypothetical protein
MPPISTIFRRAGTCSSRSNGANIVSSADFQSSRIKIAPHEGATGCKRPGVGSSADRAAIAAPHFQERQGKTAEGVDGQLLGPGHTESRLRRPDRRRLAAGAHHRDHLCAPQEGAPVEARCPMEERPGPVYATPHRN